MSDTTTPNDTTANDTTNAGDTPIASGPVVEPSGMVFGRPPTRPGDGPSAEELEQDPLPEPEPEPLPEPLPEPEPVIVAEEVVPPDASGPLLGDGADLRQRWEAVQVGFVDDPDRAVTAARDLVTEVAAALQAELERRRDALPGGGADAVDGSTDALLAAFHHYRGLFDRVLSV